MAQPHRPATPSTSETSGASEGFPVGVTATRPQAGIDAVATYPDQEYGYDDYGADGYGPEPPGRALGRREWLVLAACAMLGTAAGVTGYQLTTSPQSPQRTATSTPTPTPASTAPVTATIIPVAPRDSSFSLKNGVWQSETYRDAKFGNLKSGIGLILDLGDARQLTSVTFTADAGPLTVELRAGDSRATDGNDLNLVGPAVQASGATTLSATAGGSHRYWMIWVTQLPPGFKAKISNPVARG